MMPVMTAMAPRNPEADRSAYARPLAWAVVALANILLVILIAGILSEVIVTVLKLL